MSVSIKVDLDNQTFCGSHIHFSRRNIVNLLPAEKALFEQAIKCLNFYKGSKKWQMYAKTTTTSLIEKVFEIYKPYLHVLIGTQGCQPPNQKLNLKKFKKALCNQN